jgi:hypothetical protein
MKGEGSGLLCSGRVAEYRVPISRTLHRRNLLDQSMQAQRILGLQSQGLQAVWHGARQGIQAAAAANPDSSGCLPLAYV